MRCHDCGNDIPTGKSGCLTCGWDVDRDRPADEPDYREWDWADANGGGF